MDSVEVEVDTKVQTIRHDPCDDEGRTHQQTLLIAQAKLTWVTV